MEIYKPAGQQHKWVGDASTAYLTDPECAEKIYDFNPDARVIIMLRNPVDRAYSLYNWMVQEGYEYAASFEKALELERERKQKKIPNYFEPEYFHNYMYFSSGLYYQQVKRYREIFQEKLHLVLFEEFITQLNSCYREICRFLGIEPNPVVDSLKNESQAVSSPALQFVLRKMTMFYLEHKTEFDRLRKEQNTLELRRKLKKNFKDSLVSLKKIKSTGIRDRLLIILLVSKMIQLLADGKIMLERMTKEARDFLLKQGFRDHSPCPLRNKTRRLLRRKYKPDIDDLSRYTGLDLSSWLE